MCLPRFDSSPAFAGLLDARRGGRFLVTVDGLGAARHHYLDDTAVLVTELTGPEGTADLTDLVTLRGTDLAEVARPSRSELLRRVRVVLGRVRLRVAVRPRGPVTADRADGG